MFNFLNKLKNNFNCYFISNEGEEYWKEVDEKLKISENFIDGIVSFQAKVRKPDTKIFKILLERNNLDPKECVFIDDQEANIKSAQTVGITGILFKTYKNFEKTLHKLNII